MAKATPNASYIQLRWQFYLTLMKIIPSAREKLGDVLEACTDYHIASIVAAEQILSIPSTFKNTSLLLETSGYHKHPFRLEYHKRFDDSVAEWLQTFYLDSQHWEHDPQLIELFVRQQVYAAMDDAIRSRFERIDPFAKKRRKEILLNRKFPFPEAVWETTDRVIESGKSMLNTPLRKEDPKFVEKLLLKLARTMPDKRITIADENDFVFVSKMRDPDKETARQAQRRRSKEYKIQRERFEELESEFSRNRKAALKTANRKTYSTRKNPEQSADREFFKWLVLAHVKGMTHKAIADADKVERQSVSEAVKKTAKLIGLKPRKLTTRRL